MKTNAAAVWVKVETLVHLWEGRDRRNLRQLGRRARRGRREELASINFVADCGFKRDAGEKEIMAATAFVHREGSTRSRVIYGRSLKSGPVHTAADP